MDIDLTIQRLSQIADILKQMSWETLAKHSPDDLLADAEDMHAIVGLARQVANDLDYHNTHPSTRKAD